MAATDEGATPREPRTASADGFGVVQPHRVVVIGGGFGGLQAVRALRREAVDVTLLHRRNFHLFQPLVLEVRRRILTAVEAAEVEPDSDRRAAWLTFVVVGAGSIATRAMWSA